MGVLGSMAANAERVMTSRVGRAAIVGGAVAAAALGDKSANNDSMRMIMNSVIGTPEDGPGADEILLGRQLQLGDVFNPLAPHLPDLPGKMGPGMRNLKYAMQPGPGVFNPAISDFRGAMDKRDAYYSGEFDSQLAEQVTDNVSGTYSPRNSSGNLNASGDIVFGLHRRRFGG